VVTPMALLDEHGSDAVRYWAAKGGPGVDTAFDAGQMQVGRRLAIKLLNASKFVLAKTDFAGDVSHVLDRGMLRKLADVVDAATRDLERYDYASALRATEEFFWWFCDDYIELVKRRRTGDDAGAVSAARAAQEALSVQLRLLAPFLPFTTEEVWSWWRDGSIHRAPWPDHRDVRALAGGPDVNVPAEGTRVGESPVLEITVASEITAMIRAGRSAQKLGFAVPVHATIALPAGYRGPWALVEQDVLAGNNVVSPAAIHDADAVDVKIEPAHA